MASLETTMLRNKLTVLAKHGHAVTYANATQAMKRQATLATQGITVRIYQPNFGPARYLVIEQPPTQVTHNSTLFTAEEVLSFPLLGHTINHWRQRRIALYAHPSDSTLLLSVGVTFDSSMRVIAQEPRSAFATALDYAAQGKVYASQ